MCQASTPPISHNPSPILHILLAIPSVSFTASSSFQYVKSSIVNTILCSHSPRWSPISLITSKGGWLLWHSLCVVTQLSFLSPFFLAGRIHISKEMLKVETVHFLSICDFVVWRPELLQLACNYMERHCHHIEDYRAEKRLMSLGSWHDYSPNSKPAKWGNKCPYCISHSKVSIVYFQPKSS